MVATKKVTVDAAEKKTAVKAAETVADKKTAVKKETAAAAPKKKPAVKKETAVKKEAAVKSTLYVQFAGKEYTEKELLEAAVKAYADLGNKESEIKTVEIYLKPEENVAYYVINGNGSDDFRIEL